MKKLKPLLLIISSFVLFSCATTKDTSNSSSGNATSPSISNSTSTSSSSSLSNSSSSSTIVLPLPETLDDVKDLLEDAKTRSYRFLNWEDSSDSTKGKVSFFEKEVLEEGEKKSSEGVDKFIQYRGYDSQLYYEIDTKLGATAKKYKINDETSSSSTSEKTTEAAANLVKKINHDCADWFIKKSTETFTLNYLVEEKTTTTIEKKNSGFVATIKSVTQTGERTYQSVYEFDHQNRLIAGEFLTQQWDKDNFNSETHEVIDPSLGPKSFNQRSVKLEIGDLPNSTPLNFDISKYFITSLDDVYVSTFSNAAENKNKCEAGSSINLYIDAFTPSTALDKGAYNIVSSSEPTVIGKKSSSSSYFYALSEGTSELTISDATGMVTKVIQVSVTRPILKTISLYSSKKDLFVGDTSSVSITTYPDGAKNDVTVSCDNPSLLDFTLSTDKKTINVTAKAAGNATLTVASASVPSVSSTITFKIEEKAVDVSWLIGTWKWKNAEFDCTMVLKDDFTGTLDQDVGLPYHNTADFTWSYDGTNFKVLTWSSDEDMTTRKPSSVTINADKTIISMTLYSDNADGDSINLKINWEKEQPGVDVSWLIGTWFYEDDDIAVTFVFNSDKTGSVKQNTGSAKAYTWDYDGTNLTFPTWPSNSWLYEPDASRIVINAAKTTIKMRLEDDESYYSVTLEKI